MPREALRQASQAGAHVAYVTNNASRTPAAVAALLDGMGAPVTEADVVTSAQAAARLLADRLPPKSKVLVIGATALRLAVRERGLVPVSTAAEHPLAVVQGFGPGIDYGRLAEGGLAVRAGALFVATNADSTIPQRARHRAGQRLAAQGHRVRHGHGARRRGQAGTAAAPRVRHPHRRESARWSSATASTPTSRPPTTPAPTACSSSPASTTRARVTLAPRHRRPTYIAENLDALLEPYPEVTASESGATCGGWTATADASGHARRRRATAPPIDGLRALASAAWAAHDKRGEPRRRPGGTARSTRWPPAGPAGFDNGAVTYGVMARMSARQMSHQAMLCCPETACRRLSSCCR